MTKLQRQVEIFKPIVGYEGLYEVSNYGQIKSCRRYKTLLGGYQRLIEESIKLTPLDRYGYPCVKLSKNGVKKHFTVHQLVAIHFVENQINKPTVNHINGIKTDNYFENLEWATVSEQLKHAVKNGLKAIPSDYRPGMQGKFGKDHNQSKPIIQFDLQGNFVREWDSAATAMREGGFTPTHISRCCKGFAPYHKGYKWQYKVG